MANKYWWEEDEQKEQGEQTQQKQQNGYWWDDGSIANTVGTNITNRVNTWLKNHNNYIKNYQSRYSGRKYSYEDSYVGDSGSWLDTVSKQKSSFDTEADSILAYMDQFSSYLDADWMKSVRDTLTGARGQQSSIVESATKDNEWWGSFGSEELVKQYGSAEGVYNYFQRADGYDKKYTGMGLSDLQTALNTLADGEEKDWLAYNQTNITKNTLSQNSDWAERSKYKSTYRGGEKFHALSGMYTDTGYDDIQYDYINRDEKARGRMLVNDVATNAAFLGLDTSYLKEMTDDEIAVYNYLYDPNDKSASDAYLAMLLSDLTYRQREKQQKYWSDYAKEHPVLSSGFSVLTSPLKGLSAIGQIADYAADGTVDQNAGYNKFSYIPSTIREQVSSDIEKSGKWGKVGSWTYQLGMSMGDFLMNSAVSGGNSAVSLTLMGSGAMADTVISAKDRGLSDDQAMILGVVAGAAEVVTEKFSLDALFKGGLEKGAMKYILTNAFTEGTEEVSSSLINTVADVLVSKDKSEWQMAINDYLAKNPNATEQEAFQKVLGDNMLSLGLDFLGGALMGGTMGTGGATINYATNAAPYLQVNKDAIKQHGGNTDALIQEGLESDKKSNSYYLANKYQQQVQGKDGKGGKALTGYQIRNLLAANQDQIAPKDMQKIQKAAEKRLTDLGQTKDVSKIAELATKWATGGKLTRTEKNLLTTSEYGSRVANELHPKNIASEDFSTEWAEDIGTKQVNAAAYNKKAIRSLIDAMANAEDPAAYKSLEDRVGTESRFGVSESGKAVIRKSNEEISLDNVEVVKTEDGQLTVKLADGQEVYAGDIDFADDTQAYAFSAVADIENITPAAATAIIRDLDLSKPVGAQLNGIDEAYTYGYHGYSEADLKAGQYTSNLTNEQMMSAYKLGQSARKISDDSKVDAYKKMRTAAEAIAEKNASEGKATKKAKNLTISFNKGNGEVVSIEDAGITDAKKSGGVKVAEILHKMGLGTRVEFFESYISESMTVKDRKTGKVKPARVFINDQGVEQIAYSGVYRKADGTIRVDLNAYNGRGLTLNALAHELTHFIQQWSDRKYRVLADFLMKEYEKTDMTMHERVLKEQKRLEDIRGEEVSYDEAYDEVVANAMSKMFDDGSLVEKLAKLKEQDKNLAQKLWEGFKKILAKFIGIYEKEGALFKDAADIVEMKETFEQLQNMFAEALVEASDNFQASLTLAESQTLTEAGIGFDENTKSVYSLHFSNAYTEQIQVGKKTFDAEAVAQLVSKATSRSIEDARKWVKSEMAIANIVMQNPEFLDFEADSRYEAIKKNSDYPQGTVDLSNLCPKREEFTTMFDMLQKKYPNKLFTAQDVADMRKILSDNDITVACGACFVEDRRQLIGEIADTFIGMWKEAVDSGKPLQKTNAEGNKIELQVTKALAKQYGLTAGTKIMATDTYIPNQYDLTTYEGFKLLEKNHPTIAMAFNRYNNSRGQQSARLIEGRAEYKRQILGWSDAKVRSVNNNGGLRIFSFSDFEVVHLLDLVQVIIDCAAKGVKIQGYTKIPAFAKLVRDTGIKLNRSLIPKGDYGYHMENGKVVLDYDTTEGINIKDKNFIDESDNPNVGNIVIGINPTQIGAAMLDPFIDYIIPFHSNKAKEILKKLGTGEWVNYKESQHEKDISTGTSSKHNVNIYTEVLGKYHPTNKVEFVEAFLKECKRQGKIPRYAEFLNVDENGDYAYREGYHKLLVDFKMFDAEGNILPQGNITPKLEEGFMTELLNAEIDKKQNYEFPQKVYDAIDKKFGENGLDNSSVGNENKLTENQARGEVNDNRRIREGAAQTAEVSGTDGGRHSDYSGAAQEEKSFGNLSTSTRKRITSVVDDHIANSPNYEEFFDLLCRIANKSEDEITPAQLRKAIRQISETIYADAVAMHSVIFENRWSIFGDNVSKLRKDILEALQADSKAGKQYSSQQTDYDSDGKKLGEDQLEYFENSKVRDRNGRLQVVYHGGTVEFEFDTTRGGKGATQYGPGAYFTDSEYYAKEYTWYRGGNVRAYYLNVEKMFDDTNMGATSQMPEWKNLEQILRNNGIEEKFIKRFADGGFAYMSRYLALKAGAKTSSSWEGSEQLNAMLREAGFDGIKGDLNDVHQYAIFTPNQAKLTTNEVPSTFYDTRYSEHDTDYSNRSLLANAFEGITNGSEEYKLIQKYKGYIAELNSLENKLSEFNRQIREIRFGEGKYDAEKLKKLESEAKKIAEAINKYDQYLLSLEASKPLRKIIEQERKKEAQKTKDHVKKIQQNKKARAEQTEIRHKIRKAVRDLDKLLNRGNKKLNVKEDMKGFASKALELADYLFTDHISNDELIRKGITVRMTPKEAALVKETEDILAKLYDHADSLTDEEFTRLDAKRKANEDKLRDLLTAQRNERLSTPVYQLFDDLVKAYASLKNSSQDAVKAAYDEELEKSLRAFMSDDARVKILENMRVADMTTEELNWLYRAYTMVLNNVRNANKFHVKGMTETIDQKVGRIVSDFGSRKIPDGKVAVVARNLANKIGWDYEKLYYALDRIGSEAFTELIMNLANSENIVMQDVMEATAFRDEIVEKYGFNNWAVNKEIDREFLDNTGKKFKLTLGQMMALYAYSRREGAWDHIEYGGFVFGEAALTNPRPADSYKLSKAQCEAITDLLTKDQKGYVEAMQKYLSETMGEKGNEVSMMLYGIKMFGEKNYFPIHVAGQFKAQAQESQAKAAAGFGSMSNAGFTHAQNPNAKAPFVLEGFNEVWTDHVNEMSRYHGTVPALEDIRRVMNRSSYSDAYMESMSVKAVMENAFGKEAVDYFDNLYREANSGAITDKLQKKSKKLLSLFRKGSVAYSLSVVIQQPSAIKRAYAMIDPKYFGFKGFGALTSGVAKAVTSKWNKAYSDTYNKMLKYAPGVTLAKEIGGFDTHTGTSIREYLLDTNKGFMQKLKTGTVAEKGKAVLDVVDNNAIANLPTVADKIAWMEIWNACERETVAKHKDLTPGSDEFLQTVGDRFTEVIRATQVYDSIFAKSPMLKSKNLAVQYLVSFMNEPNTTANMVEKAVRDAVKGDWKSGVRTAAAVTYSIIFNNVLKSIIYAMRDDDEDETYQEKYIEAVVGNLMSDFNPLSYIPIARDAWSIAQGYDVERADMAIIADALDALDQVIKNGFTDTEEMTEEQLAEFDKKVTEANWKLVESMAAFFGIPVKNIRREINAVFDHARIASANAGLTTDQSRWDTIYDAVLDSIPFMSGNKAKQDKLYDALVSGDTAYVNRLKAGYKDESAYNSAVRKALRENDPRIHEAALAYYNGNIAEYKRIFKEIRNDDKRNIIGFDNTMEAVMSEVSAIKGELEGKTESSAYNATDFVNAVLVGSADLALTMKEDIISYKVDHGSTRADAEDAFADSVATSTRNAFDSGLLDEAGTEKMLTEYAGMDEEEAAEKTSYWSFIKEHPQYRGHLSQSNVEDYHEFAEPAEIPLDVFVQFLNGTKGLGTKYDQWGDVEKTKKEQVLEVIDSLPLTWQQKDALYLAAGYAESTLWDVPW